MNFPRKFEKIKSKAKFFVMLETGFEIYESDIVANFDKNKIFLLRKLIIGQIEYFRSVLG